MSERSFFSVRYAILGFTFILVVFLFAYPRLFSILLRIKNVMPNEYATLIAAFLVFLTLLGGSALGFLVSQSWYAFFNHVLYGRCGRYPRIIEHLNEIYGLTDKDKSLQLMFLDYIHRLSNDKLQIFTQRRWDLMQLIGSTLFATVIGSIIGLGVTNQRPIYLSFLILAFLLTFLFIGLWRVCQDHALAVEVSIREGISKFKLSEARKFFPDDYFIIKFCIFCGKRNKIDAVYCVGCGKKIS